ncbi:HAMP domain-containing histidine kinase [Nocardiopsis sp. CNT-189]|uniref:MtrAB system histidine kinase MtrB n=1 Tax=Nocardiopsis oceanisediminis TaxID=2816862 RepID=UPI003B3950C9
MPSAESAAVPPEAASPKETGEAARTRWQRLSGGLLVGYQFAQRAARALVRGVNQRWRGSLQLRVVSTTLLISVAVAAVLGFFLVQQIRSGLLEAQRESALREHAAGLSTALSELQDGEQPVDRDKQLYDIVEELSGGSGTSSSGHDAMILPSVDGSSGWVAGGVLETTVPERLRERVQSADGIDSSYWTYTTIQRERGTDEPGLVVGAPLSHAYELYYVFPLTHEQGILDLVQNTLVFVATLLCLVLGVIAYMVTRQVVSPVRAAAGSAERLAEGELNERMEVRGADDLARLAVSFNEMAGNLQEKIQELEELSRAQRQFVSDVSHELRTPLTTIRMAGDLLYEERDDLDPTMARSVELLQGQLERFEELLADLLEISRHDAGAATLAVEPADVRDAVLKAVGDSEQIAEKRGIKVVLRLPAEPCVAEFDTRRINRILNNLVVNAIEHSEGKDVIVTVAGDRDSVAVAVRDFGVGLKEGEEHLCFDRFWRADPARARTTGGTGLGLSIAKEDAQLHGGWLQAWGEPGAGSQFRLSLPRKSGQELRGSPLPLVPPEKPMGRARPAGAPAADAEPGRPAVTGEGR